MPFRFTPKIWYGAHDCPICRKKDGLFSKVSKSKLYWLYVCENCGTKLLVPKGMNE